MATSAHCSPLTCNNITSPPFPSAPVVTLSHIVSKLNDGPYSLLALPLRLAVTVVFWNSALSHLANWDTTLALFTDEYKLPLLPPSVAAYFAVAVEVTAPALLMLGLATRLTASLLLAMTAVIELFVYPQAWPTHIQWPAMLLVLVCRGGGNLSFDYLLTQKW
jgi:putative oxidoreductase